MERIKTAKKPFAILMAVLMLLSSLIAMPVLANDDDLTVEQKAAETLHAIGLFMGYGDDEDGEPVFGLDDSSTRLQGMIMLLRLLGEYEKALESEFDCPFDDVEGDYARAIIAYAFEMGLTNGVSATRYNPAAELSATMYLTFVLRVLGYEEGVDFVWNSAWTLTDELGITNGEFSEESDSFVRGEMVVVSLMTLEQPFKDSEQTLIESLVESGAVPEDAAEIVSAAVELIIEMMPEPEPAPAPAQTAQTTQNNNDDWGGDDSGSSPGNVTTPMLPLVYFNIATVASIEQVDGVDFIYYNGWRNGVQEAIPLVGPPEHHSFYLLSQLEDGRYELIDPWGSGAGTAASPWATATSATRALSNVTVTRSMIANAELNILDLRSNLMMNLTHAMVIDLRSPEDRMPVTGYPITTSGRGIINALNGVNNYFYDLTLSIVYPNNTRMTTIIYILDAQPGHGPSELVYVASLNRIERRESGIDWHYDWYYYNVYHNDVLSVIPFEETLTNHRFYNVAQATGGHYITTNGPFAGTLANPAAPGLDTHTRVLANVQITYESAFEFPGNADLNIVNLWPPDNRAVNLTNAFVVDLRRADDRSPVTGYPIAQNAQGIIDALQDYAELTLSLVYAENHRLVSVVYIADAKPGERPSGLVYIHNSASTERQPDDTIWTYMNVYRDGVHEVLPFQTAPEGRSFHNVVRLTNGAYQSEPFAPADGQTSWTALGTHRRIFVGTVTSQDVVSRDSNTLNTGAGFGVNITNARVLDLRPPDARSPVAPGYPITETGRGIITALVDDNKTVGISVEFSNNTRVATMIYIWDAYD